MGGWESFFVAEVGTSAALAGLLFVAVSINLAKIMAYPWLPGRALEALVVLLAVLVVSSLLLVPGQSPALGGGEVLGVGLAGWLAVVALQANSLRTLRQQRRWNVATRVIAAQAATLPFVIAGVAVLARGVGGLYWLVPGIVFAFLVALTDAWVLLVEINR
ncbi:MAG TPA: hypothetical protein VFW96_13025 [Thermomicrobiales bacterium]|nr:hypothetical protein [Thermomicrobiales bacterium]